ncbi:glycosyltransferase family 4 protein [Granulicella cerasi]|uniref:Glycosyltransferase family 4 protein n=1 Tax=Granulicella cerasi TaxID=741063 RepID=A0ABW1Z8N9_9BACT|nr:glycosyltransferase family 4 protein [Granulicella cerasi]
MAPSHPPRVLLVTREPVLHQRSGSTTLVLGLLELLRAEGCEVEVFCTLACSRSPKMVFRRQAEFPAGVRFRVPGYLRMGSLYVRTMWAKAWSRDVCRAAKRLSIFKPLAWAVKKLYGEALYTNAWDLTVATDAEVAAAGREAQRFGATCVIANYAFWAPLFAQLPSQLPTMVIAHDLLSARVQRMLSAGAELDCPAIDEATEIDWLNAPKVVLAAQAAEAELLRTKLQSTVMVQPIVLKPMFTARDVRPHHCFFVGGNILPNVTGLQFFLAEVWPRVRASVPDATIEIAGSVCGAELAEFHQPGVMLLGRVDTLNELYDRAALCVVPLLVGSGIKIKLLEALSYGKAIVSTSVGVQGLEAWTTDAISVADDAESFAAAVVEAMESTTKRQQLERGAQRLVRERFSPRSEPVQTFVRMLLGQ